MKALDLIFRAGGTIIMVRLLDSVFGQPEPWSWKYYATALVLWFFCGALIVGLIECYLDLRSARK